MGLLWKPLNPAAMIPARSWVTTEAVTAMSLNAVDAGQLDVHQDERLMPLSCEAHALFAGLGLEGLIALDLEYVPHQLQALGIVFHDQDQLIRHGAPAA